MTETVKYLCLSTDRLRLSETDVNYVRNFLMSEKNFTPSNAALRFKRGKIVCVPDSADKTRAEVNLRRAVSVQQGHFLAEFLPP